LHFTSNGNERSHCCLTASCAIICGNKVLQELKYLTFKLARQRKGNFLEK
jgi:hypothetical protein